MDPNGKLPADDLSYAIRCSYCGSVFPNLYFLQLHMMNCKQAKAGQSSRSTLEDLGLLSPPVGHLTAFISAMEIPVIPLRPNYAFWEHYRVQGCNPPIYNFMGVADPDGAGPSERRHLPRDAAAANHNGAELDITRSSTAAAAGAAAEQVRDPLDLQLGSTKYI